jgi:hypothetical protein
VYRRRGPDTSEVNNRILLPAKKGLATNYANYAKTKTAGQVNDRETANSAKTAKKPRTDEDRALAVPLAA